MTRLQLAQDVTTSCLSDTQTTTKVKMTDKGEFMFVRPLVTVSGHLCSSSVAMTKQKAIPRIRSYPSKTSSQTRKLIHLPQQNSHQRKKLPQEQRSPRNKQHFLTNGHKPSAISTSTSKSLAISRAGILLLRSRRRSLLLASKDKILS